MTDFVFLPWVRTRIASLAAPPAAGRNRRRVHIGIQIVANGTPQGQPTYSDLELFGAGDLTVLAGAGITRIEPQPGSRLVEPNYFPHVEFVDADFPWRYSLDLRLTARATPWLALVALRSEEFTHLPRVGDGLERISLSTPATSLPDLSQAWASAHVQVDVTSGATSGPPLHAQMDQDPRTHFARLLCTRKLRDGTTYTLLLVPTFEAGRLRGLGRSEPADPWNAYAWSASTAGPLELPAYAQWVFTTSAAEDFESLVRRITPVDLDALASGSGLTLPSVRGGETGYYPGYLEPALRFVPEGALQTIGFDKRRQQFTTDGLTPRLVSTLNTAVADERRATSAPSPTDEDPLFTFPAYGHHAQPDVTLSAPAAGSTWSAPSWFSELNLDRRYRLAAGTGARVVRSQRQKFLAWCFEQVGDIVAANRSITQAKAGAALNEQILAKHISRLDPATAVTLAQPFHMVTKTGNERITLSAQLERDGLPDGVGSIEERRVLAKRPAAIKAPAGTRRARVGGLNATTFSAAVAASSATGSRAVSEGEAAAAAWARTVFPQVGLDLATPYLSAASVAAADSYQMRKVDTKAIATDVIGVAVAAPAQRVAATVRGISAAEAAALESIVRGPRIPEPVYSYVAKADRNLILPSVDQVPYDSASLLIENRRVIEAILAGCNSEISQELIWAEAAFDLRATVFARFWDRGAPLEDQAQDDIKAVHTWNAGLGSNGRQLTGTSLVFAIRGELIKRFPGIVVALNRQTLRGGQWNPNAGTDIPLLFWGSLGTDTMYFGFKIAAKTVQDAANEFFFIVHEPPGRYRFGLDLSTYATRNARRDLRAAPLPFPVAALGRAQVRVSTKAAAPVAPASAGPQSWDDLSWSHVQLTPADYVRFDLEIHAAAGDTGQWGPARHAASLASVLFQKPVRFVIPATKMLPHA